METETNTLTTAIGDQIKQQHALVLSLVAQTKDKGNQAIIAAAECGRMIEDLKAEQKGRWKQFWREMWEVPIDQAEKYVSLFHTYEARESHRLDAQAMFRLEILEHGERKDPEQRPVDPFAFVTAITKAVSGIESLISETPPDRWPQDRRDSMLTTMRPIVDLYYKLGGKMGGKP